MIRVVVVITYPVDAVSSLACCLLEVRAIVEDNRMLREELKVARDRIRGHEKTIQAQQLSINKMKEQVDNLNDQLKACALQPADFQSQAEMEATINAREGSVKELESKVGVLSHKLETDSKRAKDDLRSKDREIAEIKRKLGEKTSALEAKDKELRAKVLEWKGVNKKLDSTRRILTETKRDNSRLQVSMPFSFSCWPLGSDLESSAAFRIAAIDGQSETTAALCAQMLEVAAPRPLPGHSGFLPSFCCSTQLPCIVGQGDRRFPSHPTGVPIGNAAARSPAIRC